MTPHIDTMRKRLEGQGFSISPHSLLPEHINSFYLPISEGVARDKDMIMPIIATQYVLEDINSGVIGMVGYQGTFHDKPKKVNDLGIEQKGSIDTGIWSYLYGLGKTADVNHTVSKNDFNVEMMQLALNPKQGSVSISKWATTTISCPSWLDKTKATAIEIIAAAYATKHADEIKKKIDAYKKDENKAKASYDRTTGEVTLHVGKIAKLLSPFILPLILAVNRSFFYEVADQLVTGRVDDTDKNNNLYRIGVMRKSDEENGVYALAKKILEEKEKPK